MTVDDPILQIVGVTKRFGNVTAVHDLSVDIGRGQFVTLLGPSGCGKTTTLRMIGGFEAPNEGSVYLAGENVTGLPPNKRDVNMVFQDYALFPHMTVRNNIAFGLELKGYRRADIDQRVRELLAFLQLENLEKRMPDQLSGGQRQRVALARALAPDPQVLLLDEPLGALDAKLRRQLQIELKLIQRRTAKTFIFVTHDQEEALTLSDRVLVMNAGLVEQDGTPSELYRRPRSRFVADFIGEINILNCRWENSGGGVGVVNWGGLLLDIADPGVEMNPGDRVDVALRPESIVCVLESNSAPNTLSAKVASHLFKGSRAAIELAFGNGEVLEAAIDPYLLEALPSDDVWATLPPDRLTVLRD